ncbi:MAG: DUF389 domain-containing protein [Halobaculum sp.]
MPPTAVVGIGVAWGRPAAVVGAGVLVVINFLSINATALGTLWYRGYRPDTPFGFDTTETATRRRILTLVVAILAVSSLLVGVTYTGMQAQSFESAAEEEATRLLADQPGRLQSVQVSYEGVLFRHPESVRIVVGVPAGAAPPQIADSLAERLAGEEARQFGAIPTFPREREVGVSVTVEFVTVDRSSG